MAISGKFWLLFSNIEFSMEMKDVSYIDTQMSGGEGSGAEDGEVHHDKKIEEGTTLADFLYAIPPDWEKAEAHGRANKVVN